MNAIGARLCGWCSGASGTSFLERGHDARIDADRRGVFGAAMHDAMAEREHRTAGQQLAPELQDLVRWRAW